MGGQEPWTGSSKFKVCMYMYVYVCMCACIFYYLLVNKFLLYIGKSFGRPMKNYSII